MVEFTLKLRKDLGMPLGKEVSQCAHAMGALVLGCFDFNKRQWKSVAAKTLFTSGDESLWTNALTIVNVEQPCILPDCDIVIVDQGHTVFKGVPTPTVGLCLEGATKVLLGFSENAHEPTTTSVRMVLAVNKSYMRANKATFLKSAVVLYTRQIIRSLVSFAEGELSKEEEEAFLAWCQGAFAKISLVGDEASVLQTKASLQAVPAHNYLVQSSDEAIEMIIISPHDKPWFDGVTSHLKTL